MSSLRIAYFFNWNGNFGFFSYRLISRAKQIFSTNDAYIKNININFIIIVKWILIRCSNMCIVTITFIKIAIEKYQNVRFFPVQSRASPVFFSIIFQNYQLEKIVPKKTINIEKKNIHDRKKQTTSYHLWC